MASNRKIEKLEAALADAHTHVVELGKRLLALEEEMRQVKVGLAHAGVGAKATLEAEDA